MPAHPRAPHRYAPENTKPLSLRPFHPTHRGHSHKEIGFGIIGIKGQTWRQPQLLTIARHILNHQLQIGVATDGVKTNQFC